MEESQHVGQQAHERDQAEHDVERSAAGIAGTALAGRRGRNAGHADHDRGHRDVLVAPCALAEHPLAREHQHEQTRRERRLHDDQRRMRQRKDL